MLRITFLIFLLTGSNAVHAQDTLIRASDSAAENKVIEALIEKPKEVTKDKVQYFSKLTRYGFKDLFPVYGYNSSLPYASQVNPQAEAFMRDYLKGHGKYLTGMKKWCMPYFNLIDNVFMQYGLPKELKYLAVIESNLSTAATSNVGAGGPWQFMPYTAREFGLVVNPGYDERRDYFKSTHAAARYLLILYKQLKDWLLVIAAYNGGPGRVTNAISRSGTRNFWQLQYYLPEESRNHVKKFIATHYVMETPQTGSAAMQSIGSKTTLSEAEMLNAETIQLSGKYNSLVMVKYLSMDIGAFNKYNPLFDKQIVANDNYELILPADKMQLFKAQRAAILNESIRILLTETDNIPAPAPMPDKYKNYKGKKRSG